MGDLLRALMRLPIEAVVRGMLAREYSAVEVVEAHLRQIEQLNPGLNAVVTLAPDAVERAREADAALARGLSHGPLHGIPLTVKDTIETKGLRTTSGSLRRAHHVPAEDAPAVARLKAAGAIIIGKTNVSEMAMAYDADNPVFGRTSNPHDTRLTPGGSSGGEAAAISAGLSMAGLGSDLSGSIRLPAHFCGIAGLKPTTGSVPSEGQCPPAAGPFSLGAVIGPMARRVADLRLLFRAISAGVEKTERARAASALKEADERAPDLRGWRAAWYSYDGVLPVAEEMGLAVERAARALGEAGLVTCEGRPPGIERGPDLWSALFSRAAVNHLRETYAGHEEEGGPVVRAMLKSAGGAGLKSGARDDADALDRFIAAWQERDRLRAALVDWMRETPLVVAPVGATGAFEHGTRRLEIAGRETSVFRAFGYSQTYNVYGLPSVCVPAGRMKDGLPAGVQIIGRPFAEESVLSAALIVERALGGWQRPPAALSPEALHPL